MKTDGRRGCLKRQMQALALVVMLWMCPVSVLWERPAAAGEPSDVTDLTEDGTAPKVALTFDDGPSAQYTPVLLDGLKERGIKASFFVIGANIEKDENEGLIRRMKEEGHLIGNHTYHHVDLSSLSTEDARREIEQTDQLVKEITGEETALVRPPFGEFPAGMEEPDKLYVKWTVDSRDWVTKDPDQTVKKVVTDTGENDIILMHDCYGTSVEAALQIVDLLRERGYEFVTVDELLLE